MNDLISRRVAKVLPDSDTLLALAEKKKLRVYIGIDPTATRLHLGHTIGLHILMDFARAGHEAILLFGTGTVLVGDPSLRDSARKTIDQAQIDKNIATWKEQVAPLMDFDLITIKQNGDWLTKMNLADIVNVASNISAVQLFKRESFTRRLERGDTVWYHETMYPLLQGYDSVAMDVDVEIGGTDQEFNMLMGRELQRKMNNREKFVVINPMILGTDGKQMSKTSGNCIWIQDSPEDMFGKLMTANDAQIFEYMTLLTDIPSERIEEFRKSVQDGANPRDVKAEMAQAVTAIWHGKAAAQAARDAFTSQFQEGKLPSEMDNFKVVGRENNLVELIVASGLESSKSQARRLVAQKAVRLNGEQVTDEVISVASGDVLQVGKRRFVKLSVQ